jgi:hypothetical protein
MCDRAETLIEDRSCLSVTLRPSTQNSGDPAAVVVTLRHVQAIYGEEFVNGRTGASRNRHKLGSEKEKAEK